MDPRRLLSLAAAALLATACVQDDGTRFNPFDAMSAELSADDERELGMNFDRRLQQEVTVIYDPVVAGFLNDLGQSIVRTIEPQPFVYRFRVIEDGSLNAFAVPGGYVYFHSGTLLRATSLDELAGVMGHEIAHVKARHFERMQRQNQLPALLGAFLGAAAAVAARDPAPLVLSQAANIALQLRFSREFEREADRLGGIFMTRAGYDPAGMARFFEHILREKERLPAGEIPPYLYSHPAVDERIASVERAAETLNASAEADPALHEAMRDAQARLHYLIDVNRPALAAGAPPADRARTDPLLRRAQGAQGEGRREEALLLLARAEAQEPYDPRVPFRIGEILFEAGRPAEAAGALRRAARLDPGRPLVFFRLGEAYEAAGDRAKAVYAFEQVLHRAPATGQLHARAQWEVEKLTFRIVRESGFADGRDADPADTPVGAAVEEVPADAGRIGWWARLGPRFVPYAARMVVRWSDPGGRVVQEDPVEQHRKPYIGSVLALPDDAPPGTWSAELSLEGDAIHTDEIAVVPAGRRADAPASRRADAPASRRADAPASRRAIADGARP